MSAITSVSRPQIRYSDSESRRWWMTQGPCNWAAKTHLEFREVPLPLLESGGSMRHPDVIARWHKRIERGRAIPPPIVSQTSHGTYYVHDGNHRLNALRVRLENETYFSIRVACVVPNNGYCFRFRRFSGYATYRLEPAIQRPSAEAHVRKERLPIPSSLSRRTMVLVAHPDDETGGCAGLLQRISEPMVFYATAGAPLNEFFWTRFGSHHTYSLVRRKEAAAAGSRIAVKATGFLEDWTAEGAELRDQELFKSLSPAYKAITRVVDRLGPDAVLVPAYEGGHPDHDACSFLGFLLKKRLGMEVWEMPLYHRSPNGRLTCRRFRDEIGTEFELRLNTAELKVRRQMIDCYSSQWDLPDFITTPIEWFRPQVDYDYLKPPHSGLLNYQEWGWPISPKEVCRKFGESLQITSQEETAHPEMVSSPLIAAHIASIASSISIDSI